MKYCSTLENRIKYTDRGGSFLLFDFRDKFDYPMIIVLVLHFFALPKFMSNAKTCFVCNDLVDQFISSTIGSFAKFCAQTYDTGY